MSDDDKKQSLKGNTDRPLKPKDSKRDDHSPRGTDGISTPGLSRGTYQGPTGHSAANHLMRPERERSDFSKQHNLADRVAAEGKEGLEPTQQGKGPLSNEHSKVASKENTSDDSRER